MIVSEWFHALTAWMPWANSKEFFESEFFAGFFGAGVGALTAYVFSARSDRRKSRLNQIATANAAIAMAHSIVVIAAQMKSQTIIKMADDYEAKRESYIIATKEGRTPEIGFLALTSLAVPYMPAVDVQQMLVKGTQASRAHIIAVQLRQSVNNLETVMIARNEFCREMMEMPIQQVAPIYYGVPSGQSSDLRYSQYIRGMRAAVDDCIYMGSLLQELLERYINRIRRKMLWRAPQALTFKYTEPMTSMFPDVTGYAGFETVYRMKETSWQSVRLAPKRWWFGI